MQNGKNARKVTNDCGNLINVPRWILFHSEIAQLCLNGSNSGQWPLLRTVERPSRNCWTSFPSKIPDMINRRRRRWYLSLCVPRKRYWILHTGFLRTIIKSESAAAVYTIRRKKNTTSRDNNKNSVHPKYWKVWLGPRHSKHHCLRKGARDGKIIAHIGWPLPAH